MPKTHNIRDSAAVASCLFGRFPSGGNDACPAVKLPLFGIKTEAPVFLPNGLYIEHEKAAKDWGELQLTDFGVSGIPAFQVSRYAAYGLLEGKNVRVSMNFLPGFSREQAKELIQKPTPPAVTCPWSNPLVPVISDSKCCIRYDRPSSSFFRQDWACFSGQIPLSLRKTKFSFRGNRPIMASSAVFPSPYTRNCFCISSFACSRENPGRKFMLTRTAEWIRMKSVRIPWNPN